MKANRFDELVMLLSQLPANVWAAAVTQAPSYALLKPYSETWPFGRFAVTYVMLGLNNYQLKGKAEKGYWPKILPLLPENPPKSPDELRQLLLPFYQTERMVDQKVNRLNGFLGSPLCQHLWGSDAASIAAEFLRIWRLLGQTMNQKPELKTIAFAMKCLAYALILVDETGFDFGTIPVAVDSRVRALSARLGLPCVSDEVERQRWQSVLQRLRRTNTELTMIHLDCILWQIGTLSQRQVVARLRTLGAREETCASIGDIVELERSVG